jgi:hypothetical protein
MTMKALAKIAQSLGLTQTQHMVKLIPLAMTVPNREGIYDYSQYLPLKIITKAEFEARYAPNVKLINVGTAESSDLFRAYSFGAEPWYLAMEV